MQYFYINKGSLLPVLRVELIKDGKYEYMKTCQFNNAIQNADVTFSMIDSNGRLKISKSSATIVKSEESGCSDEYIIEYQWKKRDTREEGEYLGRFEITFKEDIYESGVTYNSGNLIMPIVEELGIIIK
jgi:hypothetical protein